ncbi:DUF4189 domain-containing protein [Limnoraphis robusta]|uniref:DUF4189 domain-containing protein n=1 Tax=Limnoraphis robusta CS-951 TaxID=1637645 RepID=A0A0F5YLG4_9CYAN|nr:DUF4189 domain-containing protein [Limnoraphis robusta]KKD39025.1 hypothetical protein WN50_05615 [Limnoraphis robusta CS-951]
MKRLGIVTAFFVGTKILISNMVFAQLPDSYGAIAITPDGKMWGYSFDYPTREQAEKRALQECGQSSCKIQVWFKNACGAVAKDQNGKLGWAWADTRQQAEAAAVAACGNGSCRTETWACTTRY